MSRVRLCIYIYIYIYMYMPHVCMHTKSMIPFETYTLKSCPVGCGFTGFTSNGNHQKISNNERIPGGSGPLSSSSWAVQRELSNMLQLGLVPLQRPLHPALGRSGSGGSETSVDASLGQRRAQENVAGVTSLAKQRLLKFPSSSTNLSRISFTCQLVSITRSDCVKSDRLKLKKLNRILSSGPHGVGRRLLPDGGVSAPAPSSPMHTRSNESRTCPAPLCTFLRIPAHPCTSLHIPAHPCTGGGTFLRGGTKHT